jgi:selenium metabolism protein YedF
MNRIDCRGMSGTEPVLLTEKALSESGNEAVIVLVDNDETLQGIKKLAEIHKREIDSVEIEKAHEILIKPASTTEENGNEIPPYVVFITSDVLGTGNDELGSILMKSFLNTLWEGDAEPTKIVFMNNGVKLTCEGSHVLDTLELLKEDGVVILTCATCLAYYEITDKLAIGNAGGMYEVVDALVKATKVLTI